MTSTISNDQIAVLLERVADKLEEQHANPFRVDAYRAGAQVVREQPESVQELALSEGRSGLDELPRIGTSLAACIEEIARTGQLRLLERLDGRGSPVDELTRVPGIGERLAEKIHRELGIDTLEELEAAARSGRLDDVEGFGPRRVVAVRAILETMLDHHARHVDDRTAAPAPDVATLLDVDREYRERAAADKLRKIAPIRNNPDGNAWLPVLHTEREGWHFTAMYSNTDLAHELGRTDDWVVLYFERDGREDQRTVVTEVRGRLAGRRVVRGDEAACADHYGSSATA